VATVAVAGWALRYDHPVLLGPWASVDSLRVFATQQAGQLAQEAVGWFGWLDVRPPLWVNVGWAAAAVLLGVVALVVGDRRDRWVVLGMVGVAVVVTYVTYSRAFYGIGAGIQGRHVLPILSVVPIWSGAVVARVLGDRQARSWRVGVGVASVLLPATLLAGLSLNAKRYAVGLGPQSGPTWFLPVAQWSPPLGWPLWLAVAVLSVVLFGAVTWRTLSRP
jgi:hypothetical protein